MTDGCDKVSFAIKNTNWCNMNCAHCCECSGSNIAPNLMPLSKVEQYIHDFNTMPLPRWEYMVFTGGETLAPYYFNRMTYIPQCLEFAAQYNMVPVVKTNGVWGNNDDLRKRILHDFASAAYRHNLLMSMDISVDAFHNNEHAVFNILNDVISSIYLAPAIRITLQSLDDKKSHTKMFNLIQSLDKNDLIVGAPENGTVPIEVPQSHMGLIFYDLGPMISKIGRAKKNNLGQTVPDGKPDIQTGHCLQIDNNDIATLNYKHSVPVNGRRLFDVTSELIRKVR